MVLNLSASLPALYGDLPVAAACAAAAEDGFRCVELWEAPAPPEWPAVHEALTTSELSLTSVNTEAGDPPSFGTAADPEASAAWRSGFALTLQFARAARAANINVLPGPRLVGHTRSVQLACLRANLEWALGQLGDGDPTLLLESLNAADRLSPLLSRIDEVIALLDDSGGERVRVLFDAYHVYQEEQDIFAAFDRARPYVGHVQLADFPGRGEPGSGELPCREFLDAVVRSGYDGRVGCEFLPTQRDAVARAYTQLSKWLATEDAVV